MQRFPHGDSGSGQCATFEPPEKHLPLTQLPPPAQTLPQAPQLDESFCRFLQAPPQHACGPGHLVPQSPQLLASV